MSQADDFEDRGARKAHGGPYTGKHPVPTVQGYREHRAEIKHRQEQTDDVEEQEEGETRDSKTKRAYDSVKAIAKDQDKPTTSKDPYPSSNRNDPSQQDGEYQPTSQSEEDSHDETFDDDDEQQQKMKEQEKSGPETVASSIDPKEKRKAMKKHKPGGGREVTDPVTHLPVKIHDMTDKNLEATPENIPPSADDHRTLTGFGRDPKSEADLGKEKRELDVGHEGMRKLFPPPDFEDTKREMMRTYRNAVFSGLGGVGVLSLLALSVITFLHSGSTSDRGGWFSGHDRQGWSLTWAWALLVLAITAGGSFFLVQQISGWVAKKVGDIFEDETWDAAREDEMDKIRSGKEMPESVAWLNSLLASVWPLINPDLFASVVDTLEDVMQASLPKVVRMVSVDDIGQGSEAFRILGVKWLPTAAASQSVDSEGNLQHSKGNDRTVPGEGHTDDSGDGKEAIEEGMEAEEGDFVNMELAFAYRARSSGKSLKSKARNAHLYLKFYLPGGIAVPVWVEVRGLVGVMRLRLQLTPDPPFFELCTLTFLGQPRADLSCVPLSKHSINLMDIPLLSSFVQSAIDAALAEYVAPKSLTLDLKDMLMGDDFKKDTLTRGVVMVFIRRACGFKQGDGGVIPKSGSSDSYVTVSWGKFGKPVASTRIAIDQNDPNWSEWAAVLVSPDEINAEETLRLQLWDSDKHTADDDLGRTEISLKELMHGSKTKNKMCDRSDELRAEDPDEKMPGTLEWSVGYFSKAHIQQSQLDKQTFDPSIRDLETLKRRISEQAMSKLREANWSKDESKELHQQEAQDFKEAEDNMIISAPPPDGLPSGILGIQIHNVTGLEVARLNRNRKQGAGDGEDKEDEAEQADDLPDSYCTIVLNHRKIYRSRTKPKNAKPFFNAGTEKFVKDWKTAEVIIAVRDSREGENDPLLGVVYLPLRRVFEHRSQVMETYPLAGGIGYGRARISLVWRSVELQMPRELRGWDYGTLEVKGPIRPKGQLDENIRHAKLKLKTKIGKGKMHPSDDGWMPKQKKEESIFLGVTKRYATSMVIEFYHSSVITDSNPAIAVLWLSSIPDEEEQRNVTLKVWKGGKKQCERARGCAEYNGLEEGEQPLGEIELSSVKLWRGLSGYHKKYAGKSQNSDVHGVMEVLDMVNDEKMAEDDDAGLPAGKNDADGHDDDESWSELDSSSDDDDVDQVKRRDSKEEAEKRKMLRKANDDTSSSSSSDDDEESGVKKPLKKLKQKSESALGGKSGDGSDDDGSRGPLAQVQDYKKHHKQLHRKHRGVMQWKAARTLDWMADSVKKGKGKVMDGMFEHGSKEQGIETEV
ncbi:hypothetical protein B0H66DRAFT_507166 [Apodospora peruviana]|uniref:Meiotically up-regulated gene 190 protein n=1 Tax=Apodospora peruviana TaxID=516989 RepID=A0AAE0IVP4_9PEZI|nr:hypothetical protein B0H66DRAFT_507166 [Apodospora peruviana]